MVLMHEVEMHFRKDVLQIYPAEFKVQHPFNNISVLFRYCLSNMCDFYLPGYMTNSSLKFPTGLPHSPSIY